MFCGQGQIIIFTFSNAGFYLNYLFIYLLFIYRGLHLTCGPVQSIMIKKSEHRVMDLKLSLSCHMIYELAIGRSFVEIKILVLLCTILPIDCLSYFSFLTRFIHSLSILIYFH